MSEVINYVAVLPDGTEVYHDQAIESDRRFQKSADEICQKIVRDTNIRTSRKNPEKVTISLYRLNIIKGKLQKTKLGDYKVTPYLAPITLEEFNQESEEILSEIPAEFHSYIRQEAWDRAHSSGMEEVLNIITRMVDGLAEPIAEYAERMKREH